LCKNSDKRIDFLHNVLNPLDFIYLVLRAAFFIIDQWGGAEISVDWRHRFGQSVP